MAAPVQTPDTFTPDEARALTPYFTNTDRSVFALTNLPETVKGALFARYSRSAKSLRRLFLDEFIGEVQTSRRIRPSIAATTRPQVPAVPRRARGNRPRARSCTRACSASTATIPLRSSAARTWHARGLERPDESARVGPADGLPRAVDALRAVHRPAGRPLEVSRARGAGTDRRFARRSSAPSIAPSRPTPAGFPTLESHFRAKHPKSPEDSDGVYRSVIRAKALDTLRGLLPAATTSNVGLFGTGQAFEALLLRMFAHPLAGSARPRRSDARRAAAGHPGVPGTGRSAEPRWTMDRVSRGHPPRLRHACAAGGRRRRARADAPKSRSPISIRTARRKWSPRPCIRIAICPTTS